MAEEQLNDQQHEEEEQHENPGGEQQHEEQHEEHQNTGKSYTQDQLNTMMANEKRTARQALLKELGFEFKDDKTYKETIKGIKKTLDAGKTQAELDKEAKKAAESQRDEATSKAAYLEMKVSALSEGANPEHLDDLIALAQTKVTEDNTIEKVLKDMKKQYPIFFKDADDGSSGTGGSTNPRRRSGSNIGQYGQNLAKRNNPTTKSSYFDD